MSVKLIKQRQQLEEKIANARDIRAHFHVGSNMPGYLPESDVFCAETIQDAVEYLISELDRSQDLMAENCTAQDIETKEKGSDCCTWCSEFYDIEAVKSSESDGDLQYKVMRALEEHKAKDNKALSQLYSYLHTPPQGPDIVFWITVQVDVQDDCLIWLEQEGFDTWHAPHGEEQSIVDHMERATPDDDSGDPDDYYDAANHPDNYDDED